MLGRDPHDTTVYGIAKPDQLTGGSMAAARKVAELSITEKDLAQLQSIATSRTEIRVASKAELKRWILAYLEDLNRVAQPA
jgi:hypothetical protein